MVCVCVGGEISWPWLPAALVRYGSPVAFPQAAFGYCFIAATNGPLAECAPVGEAGTTGVRGKGCEVDILPLCPGCPPHGSEPIHSAETCGPQRSRDIWLVCQGPPQHRGKLKAKLAVGHP